MSLLSIMSFVLCFGGTAQLAVLCVLLSLLAVASYRRYLSPLAGVPGPYLASISRLWHVISIVRGKQSVDIYELHKQHGPFVRIAPNEVSVSHPDAPKKLLLMPLEKGPWYSVTAAPDYRYQTPLSTRNPKEKIERSKTFAQGYTLTNLLKSEDCIDSTIIQLLQWMDTYAKEKKPMEIGQFFSYTTFDILGEIIFSESFGFIAAGRDIGDSLAASRLTNAYAAVAGYFGHFHLLLANPLTTWLGLLPLGYLFDTALKAVAKREKNPDARFDILAHWFKALEERPDRMTLRDIHAQVTTLVVAGSDSVSCGLQTFVYHMIQHPTAWQRARDEVNVAQGSGRCLDQIVSYADAQQLVYLQVCIKESLRLFGPAGMGLSRVAPEAGVTIGGRTFPKGTVLSIHPYTMQIDEACWGKDALEFRPERWLEDDIASKEKYWLVFGLGYASCPGHQLAKIELSKILATIVRDYNLRRDDAAKSWQFEAYFSTLPHSWSVYVDSDLEKEMPLEKAHLVGGK